MALRSSNGQGFTLMLVAAGTGATVVLAGAAGHATPGQTSSGTPPRQALSADLMPACGPGAMVNVAQAALGQPRPTGPETPQAAVAEFAGVVGLSLPAGALERTVALSANEALVTGRQATGHVVRHGNHWQSDYLATCVLPVPDVPDLPLPERPNLPVPELPSDPALKVPDTPGPLPVPNLPREQAQSEPGAASTSADQPSRR